MQVFARPDIRSACSFANTDIASVSRWWSQLRGLLNPTKSKQFESDIYWHIIRIDTDIWTNNVLHSKKIPTVWHIWQILVDQLAQLGRQRAAVLRSNDERLFGSSPFRWIRETKKEKNSNSWNMKQKNGQQREYERKRRNLLPGECKSVPNPRQDTVTYAHSVQNQCPIFRVSLSHMPSLLEKHRTTSLSPVLFPPSPFLSPSYL